MLYASIFSHPSLLAKNYIEQMQITQLYFLSPVSIYCLIPNTHLALLISLPFMDSSPVNHNHYFAFLLLPYMDSLLTTSLFTLITTQSLLLLKVLAPRETIIWQQWSKSPTWPHQNCKPSIQDKGVIFILAWSLILTCTVRDNSLQMQHEECDKLIPQI